MTSKRWTPCDHHHRSPTHVTRSPAPCMPPTDDAGSNYTKIQSYLKHGRSHRETCSRIIITLLAPARMSGNRVWFDINDGLYSLVQRHVVDQCSVTSYPPHLSSSSCPRPTGSKPASKPSASTRGIQGRCSGVSRDGRAEKGNKHCQVVPDTCYRRDVIKIVAERRELWN